MGIARVSLYMLTVDMLYFLFLLSVISSSSSSSSSSTCTDATFPDGNTYLVVERSIARIKIESDQLDCSVLMNVVLVGGGGDGSIFEGHGGGSGFVDFTQVALDSSSSLSVTIGRSGNFGESGDSTILEVYGGELLLGVPGGVGGESSGGNGGGGYSGGGGGGANGFPGGAGGSNVGDGEHSPFSSEGGKGSAVDISTFQLENFKLSPGAGGAGVGFYGGGVGGVVVEVVGKGIKLPKDPGDN